MTYYSREITMPKTRREGLANFVQIIINHIEAGRADDALMSAVDLLEDLNCGLYDDAMVNAKSYDAVIEEMRGKHADDLAKAYAEGQAEGMRSEKARLAKVLELA